MIYAYLRVSTDDQDTANQRMGVEAKARALGSFRAYDSNFAKWLVFIN